MAKVGHMNWIYGLRSEDLLGLLEDLEVQVEETSTVLQLRRIAKIVQLSLCPKVELLKAIAVCMIMFSRFCMRS
ncbi:hypothetical protein PR048_032775 [Dryococelus australis]|uniref:Uncharacterized protein n=1 Tax=Dryococelus australis TaxID=614101 RepID=A0ABQ9G3X3_9NEOP|nr:hypothetical protein PR048_032775 [Dryococelus australis]